MQGASGYVPKNFGHHQYPKSNFLSFLALFLHEQSKLQMSRPQIRVTLHANDIVIKFSKCPEITVFKPLHLSSVYVIKQLIGLKPQLFDNCHYNNAERKILYFRFNQKFNAEPNLIVEKKCSMQNISVKIKKPDVD